MKAIPEGFATVTPTLVLEGAADAIELYKKGIRRKEDYRMEYPGTKQIMHACITIGNSKIFLSERKEPMCPTASVSSFFLYVEDVDASFKKALAGGMKQTYAVDDMFWGDRCGGVEDAFGVKWTLATHVRDVSPEEMEQHRQKFGKAA